MVSLVIVAHHPLIAQGVKEMALQMLQGKIFIAATGGTRDGRQGTDVEAIQNAIRSAMGPDGIVILVDIGGALISVEAALEGMDEATRKKVVIADAPVVEGAILAATQASLGAPLQEVKRMAEEARLIRKLE
jgi:dihydroxyacetone kinase phosphotransfer subunit